MPLPLISIANNASSGDTHAVFSANPLLSSSKYTPSLTDRVSNPSPSKSRTRGSATYRTMLEAEPNKVSHNIPVPLRISSTIFAPPAAAPNPIMPASIPPINAPTGPAQAIPAPAKYGIKEAVKVSPPINVMAKFALEPATIPAASP